MKILFVHALADPHAGGGAEVTIWTLMRAMRDLGHECVLLAASDKEGLRKEVREGVTVYSAKLKNLYLPKHNEQRPVVQKVLWHALDSSNPFMQGFLREVVASERPDVASVHCLNGWSALSMRTLKNAGVPIVQVLHGYEYVCVKATMHRGGKNCASQCASCRLFRLPHRRFSRYANAVVGVSRFTLERHLEQGYFQNVAIRRVIHNARDPRGLGLDEVAATRSPGQPLRIGYIGRLDPSKGLELLLQAFQDADLGDVQLWIAGNGQPDYEKLLRAQWASERIQFLGRMAQRDFYPSVDATVVPSLWEEPLGMVVAESMAFGKPVIGSRRGGISEMIKDEVNGFLFDPGNVKELSFAMRRMVRESVLRAGMGEAARETGKSFIDPQGWARKYVELYEAISLVAKA
ncbi:glycosyltransferase family 4 protein [Dyella sp. EPa41]|uniref:glycosyltransferase family 4 protein n=1 Tax=Dyella sp. EPa41 TaxID=1561194 RepID=UPI0019161B0F|nr:glycosyltransferase family 4 protein [Dyella sp. EPa41]